MIRLQRVELDRNQEEGTLLSEFFLSFCLVFTAFTGLAFPTQASVPVSSHEESFFFTLDQANQVLQSSRSFFTENKGQWPKEILFMGTTDFGKGAFTHVTYTNIWDNIDLSYFFTPQGMKYEYYVHPGADIEDLQIQVGRVKYVV